MSHHSFTHLVFFIQIQSNSWPAFLLLYILLIWKCVYMHRYTFCLKLKKANHVKMIKWFVRPCVALLNKILFVDLGVSKIFYSKLFIIICSSSKWWQKMKHGMRWLFDYLENFYFIYLLLHVEELNFCFQFFSFNCNFDFFFISDNK